jgi:hypothetical protein
MRLNTYNPDCDYCDNCGQHGHVAEDCCNPPLPDSPYLTPKHGDLEPKNGRCWVVWLVAALFVFLVLVALVAYALAGSQALDSVVCWRPLPAPPTAEEIERFREE